MATQKLTINGYASLELNLVSFGITGQVFADLPLDAAFTTAAPAENGMILAVDYATGKVKLPSGADGEVLALHYSTEKEYDPANRGLNTFCLVAADSSKYSSRNQVFYPRLGKLSVGDRFTTNAVCYSDVEFTTETLLKAAIAACATKPVYGYADATGRIMLTATAPTDEILALKVTEATTIPNGDYGVKFVVVKAQ